MGKDPSDGLIKLLHLRSKKLNLTFIEYLVASIVIMKGQFRIGDPYFREFGLTNEQVRHSVKLLEEKGAIAISADRSVITVPEPDRFEVVGTNVVSPFEDDDFLKVWNVWLYYKRTQHKFAYKSPASMQAALIEIANRSKNDVNRAIAALTITMSEGWKGFRYGFQELEREEQQQRKLTGQSDRLTEEDFQ